MGSYYLWSSFGHSSFDACPPASSGWVGSHCFRHPRLSPLCPHIVLIITTPINLPNLENRRGCWHEGHGLLFLADVGSGPVAICVASGKVVNWTINVWRKWRLNLPRLRGWNASVPAKDLESPCCWLSFRSPLPHTKFCSCLFWAFLTSSCFEFMPCLFFFQPFFEIPVPTGLSFPWSSLIMVAPNFIPDSVLPRVAASFGPRSELSSFRDVSKQSYTTRCWFSSARVPSAHLTPWRPTSLLHKAFTP